MIKFNGNIVQFGFGAVGKSFYEKVSHEILYNENKYFVISRNAYEFDAFIDLGGMAANFVTHEISKENFQLVFKQYLNKGDLLIDFADTVGTADICDWCAEHSIMYMNTGAADWPENWLNIFETDRLLTHIRDKHSSNPSTNTTPIVLQHGNNPGLVSHFVRAAIDYIIRTQHKKDKGLRELVKQNKFNEAAYQLGVRMIHVNDIDLQKINCARDTHSDDSRAGNSQDNHLRDSVFYNTWCIDAFLFEMLSEATFCAGTHEETTTDKECIFIDPLHGFLEFRTLAAEKRCRTYYPNGMFEGHLVSHEESVTIAKSLEVERHGKVIYRPSVMFLYAPFHLASRYLNQAKLNSYPEPDPDKPLDCDNVNGQTIIRGYEYPEIAEIVYKELLESGTEYVGVLLMGENFDPVWVGNCVRLSFLYKHPHNSRWQTPTITPVAMSALAAVCWMIKNRNKGGIHFPEDIADYKFIIKFAEKYISKTIYSTFSKETLQRSLQADMSRPQGKDFFVI